METLGNHWQSVKCSAESVDQRNHLLKGQWFESFLHLSIHIQIYEPIQQDSHLVHWPEELQGRRQHSIHSVLGHCRLLKGHLENCIFWNKRHFEKLQILLSIYGWTLYFQSHCISPELDVIDWKFGKATFSAINLACALITFLSLLDKFLPGWEGFFWSGVNPVWLISWAACFAPGFRVEVMGTFHCAAPLYDLDAKDGVHVGDGVAGFSDWDTPLLWFLFHWEANQSGFKDCCYAEINVSNSDNT